MEENTQLPLDVKKTIWFEAEKYTAGKVKAINEEHFNVYNAYIDGATAYATKLHQANEDNTILKDEIDNLSRLLREKDESMKVLTYDNNKLKGEVEGLTSAVGELKGENEKLKETAAGWRSLLEDILRDNNNGYIDIDEALCSRIKTFLYGE